jgi:hypothetical protein
MVIYVILGAIGLICLLVVLFVGDVFSPDQEVASLADLSRGGDAAGSGVLTTRTLAGFLTGFGIAGFVSRSSGCSHLLAAGIGVGAGLVLAILVHQLRRR